jgi:hypothetical protein
MIKDGARVKVRTRRAATLHRTLRLAAAAAIVLQPHELRRTSQRRAYRQQTLRSKRVPAHNFEGSAGQR